MRKPKAIIGLVASLIVCMGLVAPAAQAADTQTANLPDHIVNGDFSYKWTEANRTWSQAVGLPGDTSMANVDYIHGEAGGTRFDTSGTAWKTIDGFDRNAFAWRSNQTDTSVDGRAPIVELRGEGSYDDPYAEITASQENTYIYQDIDTQSTTPVTYKVSLKHASRHSSHVDSMRVLIGPPGREQPVELTRTASASGDQVGWKGTVLASTGVARDRAWDTYEGTILIPANQPVTRFTFEAVSSPWKQEGNCVDAIFFQKAYPLAYDGNGNTGGVTPRQKQ